MSVVLQISNFVVSQGWSGSYDLTLTNSGDENVNSVKLKVIDFAVFTTLKIECYPSGAINCLNTFSNAIKNKTDISNQFPAGTTKVIRLHTILVKAAAPIQVHNLTCEFQYTVY